MTTCDQIDTFRFFKEAMVKMPTIAEMMKKKYCHDDFDSCARKVVFQNLGKGHAPVDLAPNDIQRANRIIRDKTGNDPTNS
jgi:hypothetical protein